MYHMKPFLYKFIHNIGLRVRQNKPVEAFKNGFVNLALPFFGFSEPVLAETRHKTPNLLTVGNAVGT